METAFGLSIHMGWACVAAVLVEGRTPTAVRTFRLTTGDHAHPESIEPYHAAAGYHGATRIDPPANPDRVVRDGLRRQRRHTSKHLARLIGQLEDWPLPRRAALFVGRGRVGTSLERILASHAQIHVAEGNAVRDSVRRALAERHIAVLEVDRRDLAASVQSHLGLEEAAAGQRLRGLRPDNGGAWRQEERSCALAAWLSVAAAGA